MMRTRPRGVSRRIGTVLCAVLVSAVMAAIATPEGAHANNRLSAIAVEMQTILDRSVPAEEIDEGRLALNQPDASSDFVAMYLKQAEAAGVLERKLESAVGIASFGGLRMDLQAPSIEISIPRAAAASLDQELLSGLPAVSVRRVEFSMQSLVETHQRIVDNLATLLERGVDVREVWEDSASNRVVVGIVDVDRPEVWSALADVLRGVDVQRVRLEEAPNVALAVTTCQDRFYCPLGVTATGSTLPTGALEDVQLRGGVDLRAGGYRCSSGFSSRRTTDNAVVMMTAGHCFALNASVSHNVFGKVGVVSKRSWSSTASKDGEVVALKPVDTYRWVRNNWFYTDSNKARTITQVYGRSGGSGVAGAPISKSGTTTNVSSGQIVATGVTVVCPATTCNSDGFTVTLTNATRAALCSRGGDSGGAVYWSNVAHGIASLSNQHDGECNSYGDLTWFSVASDLETTLGVRIYES